MSPRSLSATAIQATHAEETDNGVIILLTIDHEDLPEPILISSDATERIEELDREIVYGTVSRGDSYVFYEFEMVLPSDEEDGIPNTTLSIANVDQKITDTIRELTSPPVVLLEMVMMKSHDTVQFSLPEFRLTDVEWDRTSVQGTISMDALLGEKMGFSYRPTTHPGVFK